MQNDVQFIWGDHAQKGALKKLLLLLQYFVTTTSLRRLRYRAMHLRQAWLMHFYRRVSQLRMLHMHSHLRETRYAHIVKEVFPIVFACDSFHTYVCGRKEVNIETDHKPLEPIFMKPLTIKCSSKCLQRMLLHLKQYNLTVKYKRGKLTFTLQTHLAELISRR